MTPVIGPKRARGAAALAERMPWWLVAATVLGLGYGLFIALRPTERLILRVLAQGLGTTLFVTAVAYAAAAALGLGLALARQSGSRVARESATFVVEIVRGVPMLVLLFYVTFVAAPAAVAGWDALVAFVPGGSRLALQTRDVSLLWRAILALALGYAAFLAEIFRAGIEAVGRGQVEAAMALGLSGAQRLRLIVLPQALRTVLPPLGNDLVSMIKDSALVSVLGVQDLSQLGKVYSASTFLFFETYTIMAYLYLIMTLGLSLLVRLLERRLRASERR